jgi:S1-C subfamily serine protease
MNRFASRPASRIGGAVLIAIVASLGPAGATTAAAQTPSRSPAGCPDSLPALYTQVSPAVVSITAISINPYDADNRIVRVMGSGVIVDQAGLILSNSHVVFGRQVITVTLDDGTALPAKLVGADPVYDIALLRIPAPSQGSLPAARLGNCRPRCGATFPTPTRPHPGPRGRRRLRPRPWSTGSSRPPSRPA